MKKPSFKQIVECHLSESEGPSFELFVQENLHKHGCVITKEEKKLVQEAIERTLLEQTAQGINGGYFDEEPDEHHAMVNDKSSN